MLDVDAAVSGALAGARAAGADLRFGVGAAAIAPDGRSVRLEDGTVLHGDAVVVCAGAWLPALGPFLGLPPLTVQRQVLLWFDAGGLAVDDVFFWEPAPGVFLYGFPVDADGLLKVAIHGGGEVVAGDPSGVDRSLRDADVPPVRALLDRLLGAGAVGPLHTHAVCLYTSTPDGHFAFGPVPGSERLVVCSACSGHGFKFAPAIGEALAALALGQEPPVDVSAFALRER